MNPAASYPYYSVECRWCREHPIQWQLRLRGDTHPPPPSNEAARIKFVRQWGWSALPGSNFSATHDSTGVMIQGHGIGHSLGMCQFGAIGLAAAGADFRSILTHYYPDTELMELQN